MSSLQSIDASARGPLAAAGRSFPAMMLNTLLNDAAVALEHDSGMARTCLAQAMALLRDSIQDGIDTGDDDAVPATTRSGLAPWQVRSVKAYIQANLDKPVRVTDLAVLTRLSTGYLSTAFRRSLGVSLCQYLARQRLEHAQRLMLSTNASLSEIAQACGFCDQAHLSRRFHEAVGSTPKSWRREHRTEPM